MKELDRMNLGTDFARLIGRAYNISKDVGREIELILAKALETPLSADEARSLLNAVVSALRARQHLATSDEAAKALVEEIVEAREKLDSPPAPPLPDESMPQETVVPLLTRNGIKPRPVLPKPVFHGHEIALNEGYVRTKDINLWDSNERIEIHLKQFEKKHGRKPNPQELLDIMHSSLKLDGVTADDQFKIVDLARSIATNGIRRPPIIDRDGTLLDGNRRLAACYYILLNEAGEFTSEQKKAIEYIVVWQLTEHATDDDKNAIIVSLNFEPDHKQDWPEYVKARKVFEEFQTELALAGRRLSQREQAAIKRRISLNFALGPETTVVGRYIRMVEAAQEFEDYHVQEKDRDLYEVKHKAAKYFQYFDELTKGSTPGGVAHELNQSPELKHTVYELLYGDKFRNWRQIRELRFVSNNDEALDMLLKAAGEQCDTEEKLETAQEQVESALSIGRVRRADQRMVGANTRIEVFVEWLENLPVQAFQGEITPQNLQRLHSALQIVDGLASRALAMRKQPDPTPAQGELLGEGSRPAKGELRL